MLLSRRRAAFEAYNFEIRKNLIEYDEAVNRQRQIVYDERRAILAGDGSDLDEMVRRFIAETLETLVHRLRDNYEAWAMEEIQTVLDDFSNIEQGPSTRAVCWGGCGRCFPGLVTQSLRSCWRSRTARN